MARALGSMIALGVLWPSYCLLCVSYIITLCFRVIKVVLSSVGLMVNTNWSEWILGVRRTVDTVMLQGSTAGWHTSEIGSRETLESEL